MYGKKQPAAPSFSMLIICPLFFSFLILIKNSALQKLDDYLSKSGPLFGGASFSQADAAIAPKLYHISVALPELRGWALPAEFKALHK
jgi:hypothetical protein